MKINTQIPGFNALNPKKISHKESTALTERLKDSKQANQLKQKTKSSFSQSQKVKNVHSNSKGSKKAEKVMPDKFYRNYHQSFHNTFNKYVTKKEEIDEYKYNDNNDGQSQRKKNTLFSSSA